jgi:hypothetical protein
MQRTVSVDVVKLGAELGFAHLRMQIDTRGVRASTCEQLPMLRARTTRFAAEIFVPGLTARASDRFPKSASPAFARNFSATHRRADPPGSARRRDFDAKKRLTLPKTASRLAAFPAVGP